MAACGNKPGLFSIYEGASDEDSAHTAKEQDHCLEEGQLGEDWAWVSYRHRGGSTSRCSSMAVGATPRQNGPSPWRMRILCCVRGLVLLPT